MRGAAWGNVLTCPRGGGIVRILFCAFVLRARILFTAWIIMAFFRFITFAVFLSAAFFALAANPPRDAALLDALEKKGILTAEEARDLKKESAEAAVCLPESVSSIRTLVMLQMRYTHAWHDYAGLAEESRFNIRRLIPVLIADTSENSRALISLYMPSSTVINTAHWEVDTDGDILSGKLKLGHWSVNFATEECDSCTVLKTPDRSILCMYFGGGDSGYDGYLKTSYGTALGFSGYHTGVYWDGRIPSARDFVYSLTVVNSKPNDICYRYDNGVSCWLTVGYDKKFDDCSLRVGATFGYADKLVSAISESAPLPSRMERFGDAYGVNPYFRLEYGDFSLHAEFMLVSAQYGKTRSADVPLYTDRSPTAVPMGFYVLGAYRVFKSDAFGEFEPVFRFSYIDTDGRGIRGRDVVFKMSSAGLYDRVSAYYAGVNWYLNGKYLKFSLGWERYIFEDSPTGGYRPQAVSDTAIAQIQVVF